MKVDIKRLDKDVILPAYSSGGAAGMDLRANISTPLYPGQILLVPTGVAISIPSGFEGQVRSRSGLAFKGIVVVNSPGTIDEDYRGEVKVILTNLSDDLFYIDKGDRIAQLVFSPVAKAWLNVVQDLEETIRGTNGCGSTGIK